MAIHAWANHDLPRQLHELPQPGGQPWSEDPNAVVLYGCEAMTIHNQAHILLIFVQKTIHLNLAKFEVTI